MKPENRNIEEKILHPANGVVMLVINLIVLVAFGFLFAFGIRQDVYKRQDILYPRIIRIFNSQFVEFMWVSEALAGHLPENVEDVYKRQE